MFTEIERRDRLADQCLDLSKIALEQGDFDSFQRLFRNSYRLQLANLAAFRLESPEEFERQTNSGPEVTQFLCDGLSCGGRDLLIQYGFGLEVLLLEGED